MVLHFSTGGCIKSNKGWLMEKQFNQEVIKLEQDTEYIDCSFTDCTFEAKKMDRGRFDSCTFTGCDLSEHNLSNSNFLDCTFIDCDLSMSRVDNTGFKTVVFKQCKLLGIPYYNCSELLLEMEFIDCMLNFCGFLRLDLTHTQFEACSMHNVDFTDTILNKAVLNNCDLKGAQFSHSSLIEADFRTAYNFAIDPENNRMKKARFGLQNLSGLLYKYELDIK